MPTLAHPLRTPDVSTRLRLCGRARRTAHASCLSPRRVAVLEPTAGARSLSRARPRWETPGPGGLSHPPSARPLLPLLPPRRSAPPSPDGRPSPRPLSPSRLPHASQKALRALFSYPERAHRSEARHDPTPVPLLCHHLSMPTLIVANPLPPRSYRYTALDPPNRHRCPQELPLPSLCRALYCTPLSQTPDSWRAAQQMAIRPHRCALSRPTMRPPCWSRHYLHTI